MSDAGAVQSRLDPARSHFIAIFGRKGSGKSVLSHRLFLTYPYDRVVIDPHGDTASPASRYYVDAEPLSAPPPLKWPTTAAALAGDDTRRPTTLRYVPDPASPSYRDDLDRVVGLALSHRRTCLWIDEIGELCTANSTGPYLRRALHQGRHRDLTLIMAGPRPVHIDPLVLAQADYVYVFDLPNPNDRRRVADEIGYPPRDLDAAVEELRRTPHAYLRYDARAAELVEFPPLPLRPVAAGAGR